MEVQPGHSATPRPYKMCMGIISTFHTDIHQRSPESYKVEVKHNALTSSFFDLFSNGPQPHAKIKTLATPARTA